MNGSLAQVAYLQIRNHVNSTCWKNRAVALRERFVYYQLTLGNKISFESRFAFERPKSAVSPWYKLRLITPHEQFRSVRVSSFPAPSTHFATGTSCHYISFHFNNFDYVLITLEFVFLSVSISLLGLVTFRMSSEWNFICVFILRLELLHHPKQKHSWIVFDTEKTTTTYTHTARKLIFQMVFTFFFWNLFLVVLFRVFFSSYIVCVYKAHMSRLSTQNESDNVANIIANNIPVRQIHSDWTHDYEFLLSQHPTVQRLQRERVCGSFEKPTVCCHHVSSVLIPFRYCCNYITLNKLFTSDETR